MKIFKYMALALAAVVTMGCGKEYMEIDPNKVPSASELQVKIDVDQTTNYVTFSVENQGVVPMWLFGEEKIDGKANKKYAYTGNGLQLRLRDAGTHSVEVKAYNAHGVSVGSKVVEFTLENTYRDPFDPSPYFKVIKGEWQWNNEAAGHFGCGPSTDSPFEWWKAGANEKADWSLYNDRMTFTEDGKYSFNPGEDGKVYVNVGFTELGTSPDGNDFMVDIAAYETTYTFENNWNDAGIEEIWLVLPAKTNLSYIPNQTVYDEPRFLVMDSKPSAMRKELKLAAQNAPNGEGTISWYYNFIPAVKVATPEELLAGTDGKGKVWVMDSSAKGHLGCGPSVESPAEWWSANADEKKDFGLYDDEITFYPDGKYVYSSGPDGKMYINWGVTAIGPNPGAEPDIDIEWPVTESTYTFDGETITLAAETPMVYVPSDAMWANPVFTVTELTETTLKVVAMNEGCYWQMIFRARDAQAAPEPEKPVVAPFDPAAATNMWNNAAITVTYWFANSAWGQIADPEATLGNNEYTFVVPEGVGGSEWQGQVVFRNTGLVLSPDKTYDFRAIISATNDGTATIKPCWEHPTEKDGNGNPADVNELFYDNGIAVTAYEDLEYIKAALPGTDIPDLKLVFDFGRFPAGTTVTVKGIVIRESQVTGGGGSQEPTFDPNDPNNLWNNAVTTDHHFFFATGNDWTPIDNAEVTSEGGEHTFVLPAELGSQQWQGQFFFQNTGLSSSAEKAYDFYCVLNSSEDHPGVTVKLCAQDDDGAIIVDVRPALVAYEDYEVKIIGAAGIDCDNLKLVLDFGGGVGGSTVVVKDIIFRESQSAPAPAPEPEPTPGEFTPGEQLDLLDAADVLPGTWTWEASTDGHFGCGDAIANPCGWWNGTANCKDGCSMYDDLMTFAADGTYTFDPVDGMTFMNTGVTKMNDKKVDNPTVPGAAAPEGDFRVSVEKQTATWELDEFGDFPAIILPAGTIFSYIPNDAFLEAPELYITGVWENQLEISAYTATGNNGGPIAWRYRLKRVN